MFLLISVQRSVFLLITVCTSIFILISVCSPMFILISDDRSLKTDALSGINSKQIPYLEDKQLRISEVQKEVNKHSDYILDQVNIMFLSSVSSFYVKKLLCVLLSVELPVL